MASAQTRFFETASGAAVEIETSGRTIRPLLSIPAALVDEAELTFDAEGIYTAAVDPANVAMVELQAHPAAFEQYDIYGDEDLTVGANLNGYQDALSDARLGKRTDDPVSLDIDGTRLLAETEREYEHTTLSKTEERLNIHPDSVRQRPDMLNLELPYRAEVDVLALTDAISYLPTDYARFSERHGDLVLAAERDSEEDGSDYATVIKLDDVAEPAIEDYEEGAASLLSMDYLGDIGAGLDDGKVTSVTVRWGQEFPLFLEFERREDKELLYEGRYMLAPRVGGDA